MSFDPNSLGNLRPETKALHAGQSVDPTTKARAVPLYATVIGPTFTLTLPWKVL